MRRFNKFFEKIDSTISRRIMNVGTTKFYKDVFSEEVMKPHALMRKALYMYFNESNVGAGVDQLADFIKPDTIKIISKDKKTADWWDSWLNKRPNFDSEIDNFIKVTLATGNGYLEVTVDKNNRPSNFHTVNDSSRIYYNLRARESEQLTNEEFWVYEIPQEIRFFDGQPVKMNRLSYIRNTAISTQKDTIPFLVSEIVWGVNLPKWKIKHLKLGWSLDDYYGRPIFGAGFDALDFIKELTKSYAIRARYKTLGRKIFMLGDNERPASVQDLDDFVNQTSGMDDNADIVTSKKVEKIDLNYSGDSDDMSSALEYARKAATNSLVPNYLTPYAEEVNRATSEEIKIPFELRLNKYKKMFEHFFNENIIKPITEMTPGLSEAKVDLGETDLNTRRDKIDGAVQLYQLNVMTYNELREAAGMDPLPNGNVFMKDIEGGEDLGLSGFGKMNKEPEPMNDGENERVREKTDMFDKVIEEVKEELRNWKVEIDENDAVAKFVKQVMGTNYTIFVSEKTDGTYVIQIFEKQERKEKKIAETVEDIVFIVSDMVKKFVKLK